MFTVCDALLINKIDYLAQSDFDMAAARERILALKPGIRIFEVSCKTGAGIAPWIAWLKKEMNEFSA